MDAETWEALHAELLGILVRLGGRLRGDEAALIHEFIDAGEFGLALEWMADVLSGRAVPITSDERAEMLRLNEGMGMAGRVPKALMTVPAIA